MKKKIGLKRITPMLIILPVLAFFACAQGLDGPRGGHMMGYGYGGGFMWLIILILVGVGIYILLQVSKSKGSGDSIDEQPLDILNKRYARGEIDKEEFEQKKRDLGL